MTLSDRYQALVDAADMNALAFLSGKAPDPFDELELVLALHDMGWSMSLHSLSRAHRLASVSTAQRTGSRPTPWPSSTTTACVAGSPDSMVALLEDTPAPVLDGGVELAGQAISWSQLLHGLFPSGQLHAAWVEFRRLGLTPGATLIATRLAEFAALQLRRVRHMFGDSYGESRIEGRAQYVRFIWDYPEPRSQEDVLDSLSEELHAAIDEGEVAYAETEALLHAVFVDDMPQRLGVLLAIGELLYDS